MNIMSQPLKEVKKTRMLKVLNNPLTMKVKNTDNLQTDFHLRMNIIAQITTKDLRILQKCLELMMKNSEKL